MESSSSSGTSKKARAPAAAAAVINQFVQCLVDGCNSDLSQCREYHRRHKVCELHSKTPRVLIGGREQRFCQQCSRFHSLEEFDEGKRSCRKRLDGHNRRRRKSQPESLSRNGSGRFSYNQQAGPTILSFSNPGGFTSSSWTTGVDYNLQNVNNSYMECGGNRFQILHGGGDDDINPLPSIPPMGIPMSGNNNNNNRLNHHQVLDSDCALSLLSSSRAETTTTNSREMGLMMNMNPMSLVVDDPNLGNLSHCSYSQGMEDNRCQVLFNNRRNSNNNNNENSHSPAMMMMFEDCEDGSSNNNNTNTLSFRW